MSFTIATADVAVAIRLAVDPSDLDPTYEGIVNRQRLAAQQMIANYVEVDDLEPATLDIAVIMVVGWMFDAGTAANVVRNPLRTSGGMAILAPWKTQRAVEIAGNP